MANNKTYICFDGDTDMDYYRLMTAWHANKKMSFEFQNAHDLNTARDGSQEESIKRQLRARFDKSRDFIVLIGEKTKNLTKFVRWEMEVALDLGLPIIGVNLNGGRNQDDRCPAIIRNELVAYVNFGPKIIEYAMSNWPAEHVKLKNEGTSGPRFYNDNIYASLGIAK
jgi:hypothetical protein